jgi:hypothetical protein
VVPDVFKDCSAFTCDQTLQDFEDDPGDEDTLIFLIERCK